MSFFMEMPQLKIVSENKEVKVLKTVVENYMQALEHLVADKKKVDEQVKLLKAEKQKQDTQLYKLRLENERLQNVQKNTLDVLEKENILLKKQCEEVKAKGWDQLQTIMDLQLKKDAVIEDLMKNRDAEKQLSIKLEALKEVNKDMLEQNQKLIQELEQMKNSQIELKHQVIQEKKANSEISKLNEMYETKIE